MFEKTAVKGYFFFMTRIVLLHLWISVRISRVLFCFCAEVANARILCYTVCSKEMEMVDMKIRKQMEVYIPRRHPAALAACGFMIAAAAVRLWHYLPQDMAPVTLWVHLVIPVAAAGVFLAGMCAGGRWARAGSIAATVLGVSFFIIKATTFAPLHQALCTVLYLTVLVLFTSTLLGLLPTKKLLYPLFALPLIYHILVEATQQYFFAQPPVPVWYWMPEISVLCIMAGLLCLSVSLETRVISKEAGQT